MTYKNIVLSKKIEYNIFIFKYSDNDMLDRSRSTCLNLSDSRLGT